ncbi:hypothetical protein [Flexivirga alba]|uniref:Peptidase C39-like domain-containing protein n=1 Tax=Flexivirga alba TaxID=702742 RepID=A0ABW2ACZ4_9MICO
MRRSTRAVIGMVVTVGTLAGASATAYAQDTNGPHLGAGTTGAPAIDRTTYRVPAAEQPRVDAKQRMVANLTAGQPLLQGVQRRYAGLKTSKTLSTSVTATYTLPTSLQTRHVLHWEGEGNGNKRYTCGPAASRNVMQSLMGKDYGEAPFEKWEKTSPTTGTMSVDIASALELHFGHIDTWSTHTPTSPANLYANVKVTVGAYHHGTIQNVRTSYLPFWNGHATNHFNAAVGYTSSAVTVGEEWYPAKIGVTSNYGQPYGFHNVSPTADYNAIHYAPSGKFIG